jgi:hypothetical protein
VVIRRVVERTNLAVASRRPEQGVRQGVTYVPKRGVRVIMREAPKAASTTTRGLARSAAA